MGLCSFVSVFGAVRHVYDSKHNVEKGISKGMKITDVSVFIVIFISRINKWIKNKEKNR